VSGFSESFAVDQFTLLLGMLADKDVAGTLAAAGRPDRVLVTTAPSPRALPAAELGAAAAAEFGADRVEVIERLPEAWAAGCEAAAATPNGALLVAGSVTLAAQARLLAGMSEA
jgi:dihydrofolate synthase/folylpolyglutamate synthase